jgi:hypothetical protein
MKPSPLIGGNPWHLVGLLEVCLTVHAGTGDEKMIVWRDNGKGGCCTPYKSFDDT